MMDNVSHPILDVQLRVHVVCLFVCLLVCLLVCFSVCFCFFWFCFVGSLLFTFRVIRPVFHPRRNQQTRFVVVFVLCPVRMQAQRAHWTARHQQTVHQLCLVKCLTAWKAAVSRQHKAAEGVE